MLVPCSKMSIHIQGVTEYPDQKGGDLFSRDSGFNSRSAEFIPCLGFLVVFLRFSTYLA